MQVPFLVGASHHSLPREDHCANTVGNQASISFWVVFQQRFQHREDMTSVKSGHPQMLSIKALGCIPLPIECRVERPCLNSGQQPFGVDVHAEHLSVGEQSRPIVENRAIIPAVSLV